MQFSRSDCKSVDGQDPGTKLPNPQGMMDFYHIPTRLAMHVAVAESL